MRTDIPPEVREFLIKFGFEEPKIALLLEGLPIAFNVSEMAEGTLAVIQLRKEMNRLRIGLYTIHDVGKGTFDFISFETRASALAKLFGLQELELMGIEITNSKLREVLVRGGFTPSQLEVPEDLGGGFFSDVLSRIDLLF